MLNFVTTALLAALGTWDSVGRCLSPGGASVKRRNKSVWRTTADDGSDTGQSAESLTVSADYQLLYNPDHPQLKLMSAMSMNYTTVATLNRSGNKKFASISYS